MPKPTEQQRHAIWAALTQLSRQHRAYPDAKWSLPEADLSEIEGLAALLKPVDPVASHRYLFDKQMPDLGTKRADFEAYEATLNEARRHAIREIVDADGVEGIERLLESAKEPFAIGWSIADSGVELPSEQVLQYLDSSEPNRAAYARGYVQKRSHKEGLPWLDATLPELAGRPLAEARVLNSTRIFPDAWERAAQGGTAVEAAYWQEFMPVGLGPSFQWLNEAAEKLLKHGRAAAAVDLLALYAEQNDPPAKPELVADALESLIVATPDEQRRASPYDLQRLLELLRKRNFDEDRLSMLEWRLLPGLGYGTPAPSLERRLARDPKFFVEILSLCFKRDDGKTEPGPDPLVAQNAFHLLEEWRVVPGTSERQGDVDETKLSEWLRGAFAELDQADRVVVGSIYIGHVFAHAKADIDGTWPTRPVRDAIERLASDEVDRGFGTQIFNNRGVTSRSLTAGGEQERELAGQFETWTSMIQDMWPRTAAVLDAVAQGYRSQAQAQDEEADRFKKGLDPH